MSHESQNRSACIPPPSDYTPRKKSYQSGNFRDRNDRGGRGGRGYKRGPGQSSTFQREKESEEPVKIQPKDKFHRNDDDDYFAHVPNDESGEEESTENTTGQKGGDDEDDPLDAYMKSLEGGSCDESKVQLDPDSNRNNVSEIPEGSNQPESDKRGIRLDIDDTDDVEESYYQYVEQSRGKKSGEMNCDDSDEKHDFVEYDKDGNILSVRKMKKEIDPLLPIDHSSIEYQPFEKNFYQEHSDIQKLTPQQSEELRAKLDIKVSGDSPPKPVCSFAHFKFDEQLMKVIRRSKYTQPSPIQAQAIPAALLGRNIIGIAMTGSGKTAAYLWPMIVHIMGQPDLKRGDGPIALILVPTRELALQVYSEAKKFSSSYKIAVVCAYGGGNKYEQSRDLEAGAEIVVATPGRMIDLIKSSVTNLKRVTYLVLDEADRFFEMGFEAQVRSICDHIRPDRQTLLFSATFKKRIEQLARTVTENPVKIVQKALGEANEDVNQHVVVLPFGPKKWEWLRSRLIEFTSAGSVLIFVTRIINSEELHANLKEIGNDTLLLHGDMEQSERNRVITSFKKKDKVIMIATDVAARGLDISHIRTVINYDVARDIDTHIHRVGRTGRAGTKGDAYTLITEKDREFAGHLVKNLESSHQKVSDELMKIAINSSVLRKSRGSKHIIRNSFNNSRSHNYHHQKIHQHQTNEHNHPKDISHQYESKQHSYPSSSRYPPTDRSSQSHQSGLNYRDEHYRFNYDRNPSQNEARKRSKWY